MPKSSPPILDQDVIKESSSIGSAFIYISIILCIVVIVAFFMYKVYKKLEKLNDEIINISARGDELESSNKEKGRQIESLGEHFGRHYKEFKQSLSKKGSDNIIEIPFENNNTPKVEDKEVEYPRVEEAEPITVSTPIAEIDE